MESNKGNSKTNGNDINELAEYIIPDRAFRKVLVDSGLKLDNLIESAKEIEQLEIHDEKIMSLRGIELLVNLKHLSLYQLIVNQCDLSSNSKLESISLRSRGEFDFLKALSFHNNRNLVSLSLDCDKLIDLNIGYNKGLKSLEIKRNNLKKLDLPYNSELETLKFCNNNEIELDLSNALKLTKLGIEKFSLEKVKMSKNIELKNLSLDYCKGNLDFSKYTKLESFYSYDTFLNKLDFTKNLQLESFYLVSLPPLHYKSLDLDLSQNRKLKYLHLVYNRIDKIDISNNTELLFLELAKNEINQIDISKNKKLKYLTLDRNKYLTRLDTSKNTDLERLIFVELCYTDLNCLKELNISKNKKLKSLCLEKTILTKLDISNNSEIEELELGSNYLTELNVSGNLKLKHLWLNDNKLTELDVSSNTKLEGIDVSNNRLTELDLSKNIRLENDNICVSDNPIMRLVMPQSRRYKFWDETLPDEVEIIY